MGVRMRDGERTGAARGKKKEREDRKKRSRRSRCIIVVKGRVESLIKGVEDEKIEVHI